MDKPLVITEESNESDSSSIAEESTIPSKYIVTKYRWVVVLALAIALFANGTAYTFYAPIMLICKKVYSIDLFVANLTQALYTATYLPVSFLIANPILEKYGLTAGLYFGGSFFMTGIWIRLLINRSFAWAIIGSLIASIGQPVLMNSIPKVSALWFPQSERAISSTITALSGALSASLGMIWPTLFIDDLEDDLSNVGDVKNQIFTASIFEAIWLTSFMIIAFIIYMDKPKYPPSKAGAIEHSGDMWPQIKSLLSNLNFMNLNLIYFVELAILLIFSSNLAALIEPFGFDAKMTGILGAAFLISGIVSSGLIGVYLGKTKKYKRVLLCIVFGSAIAASLLVGLIQMENTALLIIGGCFLGIAMIPLMSVGLEIGCEIAYPTGETAIAGVLTGTYQLGAVPGVLVTGIVLNDTSKAASTYTLIVLISLILLTGVCSIFFKENLKRLKAENFGTSFLYKFTKGESIDWGEEGKGESADLKALEDENI